MHITNTEAIDRVIEIAIYDGTPISPITLLFKTHQRMLLWLGIRLIYPSYLIFTLKQISPLEKKKLVIFQFRI